MDRPAHVFVRRVPYGMVPAREVPPDAAIARQLVCMNRRRGPHRFPNCALECPAAHVRNNVRAHPPTALDQRDDGWLIRAATARRREATRPPREWNLSPLRQRHVAWLATYIGL